MELTKASSPELMLHLISFEILISFELDRGQVKHGKYATKFCNSF